MKPRLYSHEWVCLALCLVAVLALFTVKARASDWQTPTEQAVAKAHERLWDNEGGKGNYYFSHQDRIAFGAQVVIGILDVVTTMHAVHSGCPETNSLIGSHPSDGAIIGFAVIRTIGFYYLLDHSGAAGRAFTWGANATGAAIVANNLKGC